MGQVCSSLPIRKWPIPLLRDIALAGAGAGADRGDQRGELGIDIGFVFFMAMWIGIAVFVCDAVPRTLSARAC